MKTINSSPGKNAGLTGDPNQNLSEKPLPMESKRKTLVIKILEDYQRFKGRRIKNKDLIQDLIKEIKGKRVRKKQNKRVSVIITRTELARRLGMDRKTLMKRIHENDSLCDDLMLAGFFPTKFHGFTPNQVKVLCEYLGVNQEICKITQEEGEKQ
jgi:hypothetical protein